MVTGMNVYRITFQFQSFDAIQLDNTLGELNTNADYLLFDAPNAGSGQLFDWKLLAHHNFEKPFFIAGGLTVDNVAEAQSLFTPYAVDAPGC